jgi:hypothetical protein
MSQSQAMRHARVQRERVARRESGKGPGGQGCTVDDPHDLERRRVLNDVQTITSPVWSGDAAITPSTTATVTRTSTRVTGARAFATGGEETEASTRATAPAGDVSHPCTVTLAVITASGWRAVIRSRRISRRLQAIIAGTATAAPAREHEDPRSRPATLAVDESEGQPGPDRVLPGGLAALGMSVASVRASVLDRSPVATDRARGRKPTARRLVDLLR